MYQIGNFSTFQTSNFCTQLYTLDTQIEQDFFSTLPNRVILGGGSNILLSQELYEDRVFVRNMLRGIVDLGDGFFQVKSATTINQLVTYVSQHYPSNLLNPWFGLPGTVGGAVVNNSESFGLSFGDIVHSVELIDDQGKYQTLTTYDKGYRYSQFKHRQCFIISVTIQVPALIDSNLHEAKRYMDRRLSHQAYTHTCGSYFANIKIAKSDLGLYQESIDRILTVADNPLQTQLEDSRLDHITIHAGWLSQMCGMCDYVHHGVRVYKKHGNFLVNEHNTHPKHILELAEIIKSKVQDRFALRLQEEVVII